MSEGFVQRSYQLLAAASGSNGWGGLEYGKITTLVASATNYIRLACDRNVSKVDWIVKADKAHTITPYHAESNVTGGTLTLTDATAVDDGDTFLMNGLTFTAETTEGDAVASARKWYHASQAAGAAALSTLLQNTTYGVPGIGTIAVTAPTTTDVLTISSPNAPILQFNQGTSASNEIAWAETTLAGLVKDDPAYVRAANSTTAGESYEHWVDGAPYVYLGITNNDASNAMTYTVGAIRYWV